MLINVIVIVLNRISVTHSPVTAIVLDIDDVMLSDRCKMNL